MGARESLSFTDNSCPVQRGGDGVGSGIQCMRLSYRGWVTVSIPSHILFLLFQCLCVASELFTIADHQGSSRLKLQVYPRVEIVSQTQDCSVKLAHESKLLHRVLQLKRRLFSVADDQDYTTPW